MATTTTISAGAWNTAGNWDNGVPTVSDDAVVDHAMSVGSTGATFKTLDNNSTITLTANQTWVIADGGSIDNSGGEIDTDDNDIDWVVTASVGTTNWTWTIDSGTFDYGDGTHTFKYGTFSISANYVFSKGTYSFPEKMSFTSSVNYKRYAFDNLTVLNFSAGKTYTLGDGSNICYLLIEGECNAPGSSSNRIVFDSNGGYGFIYLYGTGDLDVTFDYVDFYDGYQGVYITSYDTTDGDIISIDNCRAYNNVNSGFHIYNNVSDVTYNNCDAYNNTKNGFYVYPTSTGGGFICNDCSAYSNGDAGYSPQSEVHTAELNRCFGYGNSKQGLVSDNPSKYVELESSLFYENTQNGVEITNSTDSYMTNCTSVDNGSLYANVYVDLATGNVFPLKNVICYGAKYGIQSNGSVDPVVTYSDVYGASDTNYKDMTDPTGSNGNISSDPKFKDAANDDYSLDITSPCINTGTSTGAPATDITNTTWKNANPEMGAYTKALASLKVYAYIIA